MNVKDILLQYLKANGYDGLSYTCCGCGVDNLVPCDHPELECQAARKVVCKDVGFAGCETCDYGCNDVERDVACLYVAVDKD